MRLCLLLLLAFSPFFAEAQKMLLLEKAYRVKPVKMYVGETLHFRLKGKENYWYERSITDILPDSKILLLDNYPVHIDSIAALRVRAQPVWRLIGGTLFTFGSSLVFATTVAALYGDKQTRYGLLYASAGGSMAGGYLIARRRTLHMGKKYRLRAIEISFPFQPPPSLRQ